MHEDTATESPTLAAHLGFPTINATRAFALAGHAIFTVVSGASGERLTFKVGTPKTAKVDDAYQGPWFVSVLTGANNESDYTFLGSLWRDADGSLAFRRSAKSPIGTDAPSQAAARWLFGKLLGRPSGRILPSNVAVHHEGRCGRCGRLLTVPESIESGIGPVCAEKEAA